MPKAESDLPFGDAFSPGQLDAEGTEQTELALILELVAEHEGDEESFKSAVAKRFFETSTDPGERARLVALGLKEQGYQIVDEEFTLTPLGRRLHERRTESTALYDEFAQHILLRLHGRQVIEVIKDLQASGKQTTTDNIKEALSRRFDITVGETSNHWSQMRGWLNKADIVNKGSPHYTIDSRRLNEVLGLDSDELEILEEFTDEQRAFLRALAAIDPDERIKNTKVRELASNIHDTEISQSKITEQILDPLAEEGYLEVTTNRGSANLVATTPDFDTAVLEPLLGQFADRTGVPRDALRLSFSELENALEDGSPSQQQSALNALAVRLGRQLGLEYVGQRTADSGSGEVSTDVIMDDTDLTVTRWLIHCSAAQSKVTPTQIASVTTTARLTNANTILYVARAGFREDAIRTATRIMKNEPYTILRLDNQPNPAYDENPTVLIETLEDQLDSVRRTKALPDDGPFRGRSLGLVEESESAQSTVTGFDDDFDEFTETEGEDRSLSDFSD